MASDKAVHSCPCKNMFPFQLSNLCPSLSYTVHPHPAVKVGKEVGKVYGSSEAYLHKGTSILKAQAGDARRWQ